MDVVPNDDKVVVPDPVLPPVSAGSVEAGPVAPVEAPTQAAEAGSSYPDFKPSEDLRPFTQPSIKINIPGQIATMPPIFDMGTAKVDIRGLEEAFDGDPEVGKTWKAGVELRQEERDGEKAELPKAA